MRITVEIEDSLLDELAAITGESKKSPAVARAVAEFVRRARMKDFGRRLREGEFADAFDDDYNPEKFDR